MKSRKRLIPHGFQTSRYKCHIIQQTELELDRCRLEIQFVF